MATRTTVSLVDDLDGSAANTSVQFEFDGTSYEIDLNDNHAEEFRRVMTKYTEAARRVRGGRRSTAAKRAGGPSNTDKVRAWARDNGYTVGDRGRIPTEIVDAYNKAN